MDIGRFLAAGNQLALTRLDRAMRALKALTGFDPRPCGDEFVARCPVMERHAHQDQTPSLSLAVKRGDLQIHCFAGCPRSEIEHRLGIRTNAAWQRVARRQPGWSSTHRRAVLRSAPTAADLSETAAFVERSRRRLLSPDGQQAAVYLTHRGVDPKLAVELGLGLGAYGFKTFRQAAGLLVIPVAPASIQTRAIPGTPHEAALAHINRSPHIAFGPRIPFLHDAACGNANPYRDGRLDRRVRDLLEREGVLFAAEGVFDALSIVEGGFAAIALRSTSLAVEDARALREAGVNEVRVALDRAKDVEKGTRPAVIAERFLRVARTLRGEGIQATFANGPRSGDLGDLLPRLRAQDPQARQELSDALGRRHTP